MSGIRRQFEARFPRLEFSLDDDGEYLNDYVNHQWIGYKAGVESIGELSKSAGEPVAWRFNVDDCWFTGSSKGSCEKTLKAAGLSADLEPLYTHPVGDTLSPSATEAPDYEYASDSEGKS